MPEKYRIKSINGTNVTDRDSIVQKVQQVPVGQPLEFVLERSGGYAHNPLRGKNDVGYPQPACAQCVRSCLTCLHAQLCCQQTAVILPRAKVHLLVTTQLPSEQRQDLTNRSIQMRKCRSKRLRRSLRSPRSPDVRAQQQSGPPRSVRAVARSDQLALPGQDLEVILPRAQAHARLSM